MYNIDILSVCRKNKLDKKIIQKVKKIARYVLQNEAKDKGDYELSIVFSDEKYITELNEKYFKRNYPTDVIAFPQSPRPKKLRLGTPNPQPAILLGDIVISLDAAKKQAPEYNVTFLYEILNLTVHGILHLLGEKDTSYYQRKKMLKKQEEIIKKFYEQK